MQFQTWLRKMGGNPALRTEFEQFKAVSVWRVRSLSSFPALCCLDLHVESNPSFCHRRMLTGCGFSNWLRLDSCFLH